MAPLVIKTMDGFYALRLQTDSIIDTTMEYWYKPLIINGYHGEDFKSMKKSEVSDFAQLMRIKTYAIGKTGKAIDKSIAQLLDDIKGKWDSFFQPSWEWEEEENDAEAEQSTDPTTASSTQEGASSNSQQTGFVKGDGMKNHGFILECFRCGRGWPINQSTTCATCRRTWTPTGIKDPEEAQAEKSESKDQKLNIHELCKNDEPEVASTAEVDLLGLLGDDGVAEQQNVKEPEVASAAPEVDLLGFLGDDGVGEQQDVKEGEVASGALEVAKRDIDNVEEQQDVEEEEISCILPVASSNQKLTRSDLEAMKKDDLMEHLRKHGVKPNRKSIKKGNLIDLIIKDGYDTRHPESDSSDDDGDERQNVKEGEASSSVPSALPGLNMTCITGSEIRAAKSVDELLASKFTKSEPKEEAPEKLEIEIKMPKQFKIVWHGSRSNQKRLFVVSTDQRLDTFKKRVFNEYHGLEIDNAKYEHEEDWTASHNIRIKNYSTVCHKDWETWQFYIDRLGIDISHSAPPLDVTFQLVIDGGVKGKFIGGPLKWTTQNADKIQRLPQVIQTLVNARFDQDDLRAFMSSFSNDQVESFSQMWDHSKLTSKYKVNEMMRHEPNMKFIDEVSQLVDRYCEQFKSRFHANFDAESIKDELMYQIRRRSEAAAAAAPMQVG